jgi:hypothetical protein
VQRRQYEVAESDACVAICAVSASRISPTRMMSGSCAAARVTRRERHTNLLIDWHCGTWPVALTGSWVRIFSRPVRIISTAASVVVCRSRRTRDQHDAVRPRDDFVNSSTCRRPSQLHSAKCGRALVEQTEDDASAQGRHCGHAHVDLTMTSQTNAPIPGARSAMSSRP